MYKNMITKTCMCVCMYIYIYVNVLTHFSHFRLFETPRTIAHQALLSVGLSRQECWSGLPISNQGSNLHLLCFLHWQVDSLPEAPP